MSWIGFSARTCCPRWTDQDEADEQSEKPKTKSKWSQSILKEWNKEEILIASKEVVTTKLAKTNVYFQTKRGPHQATRASPRTEPSKRTCTSSATT